jgi:hypothetical protein
VRFDEGELSAYFKALDHQPSTINPQLLQLLHQFEEAKNFGSLIQPCLSESEIVSVRTKLAILNPQPSTGDLLLASTHLKVLRVLEQAEALTQRYHVVVANPPYVGTKQMPPEIKVFAESHYPESKADLFAMFIERAFGLVVADGTAALVTMQSWMFLSSFQALRMNLLNERTIITAAHMGNMVMGITIEGHRLPNGAFDLDASELQSKFLMEFLMEYLTGATIALFEARNPKPQKNDIPPLNIFQPDNPGR